MIDARISGAPLSESMLASLQRAEVELELNLPSTCVLEVGSVDFTSGDWQGVDLTSVKIGDAITLSFGAQPVKIFEGQVGEIQADYGLESTVSFRGFDALYRLQFGTVQQTYEAQTDSGIATRIAERHQLEAEVDDSVVQYPYLLQANQSDFAFLAARAARMNFELFVTGRTLHFRRTRAGEASALSVQWKEELLELSVRVRAVKRGSSVQRVGWDVRAKSAIVANVSTGPATVRMGGRETGYQVSEALSDSPISGMDPEIGDAEGARAVAQAAWEAGLDEFIEAEASMQGDARLVPGINIRLEGIGNRLSGLYYVTAARHVYTPSDGYRTFCTLRRTGV